MLIFRQTDKQTDRQTSPREQWLYVSRSKTFLDHAENGWVLHSLSWVRIRIGVSAQLLGTTVDIIFGVASIFPRKHYIAQLA